METTTKRHPIRRKSYTVHSTAPFGGQIVGVVTRKRQDDWQAELAGGRHVGGGFNSRQDAIDAIVRRLET